MNHFTATSPEGQQTIVILSGVRSARTGMWAASAHRLEQHWRPMITGVGSHYTTRAAALEAVRETLTTTGWTIPA